MYSKIKIIFIASLILALPILLYLRNGPTKVMEPVVKNVQDKVTLECVVPFEDVKKKEALINFTTDMKSVFPDYNINLSFVKGDANAYNTKMKVRLYSDTPPDVFYSGDERFTEELYASKSIQPLEKKLNDLDYWKMVIPSAKVTGDAGHIYAVPMDQAYYNIILINTDLFTKNNVKVPESFEELKTAVKQFKDKNITPIAIGGKDGMSVYNMIEGFACTRDYEITSKIIRGDDTFSGEVFSQAAESVTQLIKLGAFQDNTETISDEQAGNLFYSSKAAIYCTTSDQLNIANNHLKGKVAISYYPLLGESDGSTLKNKALMNIVSGGTKKDMGLLISSSTKYPTEAAKIAVEMSKYYNKYLYEKHDDGARLYNLDIMKWTPSIVTDPGIHELMLNVKQKGHVNTGLFENNLSPEKKKSIEEANTAFMSGLLSVSDYLKEMNMSMKLK